MDSAKSQVTERSTLRAVGPHFLIAPPGAEQEGLAAAMGPVRADPRALVLLAAAPDAAPVLRESLGELTRNAGARGPTPWCWPPPGSARAAPTAGVRPNSWPSEPG